VTTIIRDRDTIERALQHGVLALTEDEAHVRYKRFLQPGDTLTLETPPKRLGGRDSRSLVESVTVKVVALVGSDKVHRGIDASEQFTWILHGDPYDPVALLVPEVWLRTLDLSLGYVAVIEKESE
jgi:hypothetical protein